MKQSNAFPLLLLFGGLASCIYFAIDEQVIEFAVAAVVAAIGWQELSSTEEFNERFDGE